MASQPLTRCVGWQGPRSELLCGLHLLMLMFLANKAGERGATIPNAEFYNATVSKHVYLQEEFMLWVQHKVSCCCFCQSPWELRHMRNLA